MNSSCCAPERGRSTRPIAIATSSRVVSPAVGQETDAIELPGGAFLMGGDDHDANPLDGEGPVREVVLSPFAIGATQVTTTQFTAFVDATGYVTEAEELGWSFVFAAFLPGPLRAASPRVEQTPWWCAVTGATWRSPEGPGSDLTERADHPVVHVSWRDAETYAAWAGGKLPTEAEWEYAARGGLVQARYPWGEELTPDGQHMCNIWQGRFPVKNTAEDGYRGTCPVRAYPANSFGVFGTSGNVWEMVGDRWTTAHPSERRHDPRGPESGPARVMRGGSYLCHESYCNRYRVAARTQNTPDSSSGNQGFRIAYPRPAGSVSTSSSPSST